MEEKIYISLFRTEQEFGVIALSMTEKEAIDEIINYNEENMNTSAKEGNKIRECLEESLEYYNEELSLDYTIEIQTLPKRKEVK